MHLAYLSLVHKNPLQVRRLVSRLRHESASFYIHVDASVASQPFREALCDIPDVVQVSDEERVQSIWGDFGIVRAALKLVEVALSDPDNEWLILLSGEDYPLHPPEYIRDFFAQRAGTAFIHCLPVEQVWPQSVWFERLNHHKVNLSPKRGDYVMLPTLWNGQLGLRQAVQKARLLMSAGKASDFLLTCVKRSFPFRNFPPHGGSAWWAMPRSALEAILRLVRKEPLILRYFERSLFADELFFQNCLMAAVGEGCVREVAPSLTYTRWENSGASPAVFGDDDFEEIAKASGEFLFVRKFDESRSAGLLARIDAELLRLASMPRGEVKVASRIEAGG